MIRMQIEHDKMELELRGSDELIVEELSVAVFRMLKAMESSGGYPVRNNLSLLTLKLLSESQAEEINTSG